MSLFSHLENPQRQKSSIFENKKKIIVIAGPTGTGKTAFSIKLAKILGGEIISADSMQVYRGMDIGTAKVSRNEAQGIPHHLIDICEVQEHFDVVQFFHEAHQACQEIFSRGRVPIVVGGSGFYLHAFLYGPPLGPPSDPEIRSYLEKQMQKLGSEVLYERLQMLDPVYAQSVTEKDKHKIIRALEIIVMTKRPVSEFPLSQEPLAGFDFRCWFLHLSRETLYLKIENRCEEMVKNGLIEEVRALEKMGIRNNPTASQAIGYKQCLDFLQTSQSDVEKKEFLEAFKKASRRYAKRQFTWFKKEKLFRWMNLEEKSEDEILEWVLQDFERSF